MFFRNLFENSILGRKSNSRIKYKSFKQKIEEFEYNTRLKVPKDLVEFHTLYPNKTTPFKSAVNNFIYTKRNGVYEGLEMLLSMEFASALVDEIECMSVAEKNSVLLEAEFYGGDLIGKSENEQDEAMFDYLAGHAVNTYDGILNRFRHSLVQRAYEKLNSDPKIFRFMLSLYEDCSGCKGLILAGKNIGCITFYNHGVYSTLIRESRKFEFLTSAPLEWEEDYLTFLKIRLANGGNLI